MIGRKDQDRPVTENGIEVMARERFMLADDHIVGLLADDQVVAGIGADVAFDAGPQLSNATRAEELQMAEFRRARKEMHVGFDEAWNDTAPRCVDDAGAGTLLGHDVGVAAHPQDAVARNRHGLGPRARRIHGERSSAGDDERGSHASVSSQSMPSSRIMAAQAGRAVTSPTSWPICG